MEDKSLRFWGLNLGSVLVLMIVLLVGTLVASVLNPFFGNSGSLILLSLFFLGIGAVYRIVFRSFSSSRKMVAAVSGSTVIAVMASYSKITISLIDSLSSSLNQVPSGRNPGFSGILDTGSTINPDLFFIALLISFNLPIIYSWAREEIEYRHLLLYLIPLAVFLLIPAIFSGLLSGI